MFITAYFDSGISGRSVLTPPGDISMMYAELSVDSSFRWPPESMAWVSLTGTEFEESKIFRVYRLKKERIILGFLQQNMVS